MKGRTPVVRVGCQMRDSVYLQQPAINIGQKQTRVSYQNIKLGSLLVLLGSTSLVPLFLVKVTSMNLGVLRAKESTVTGTI